MQTSEWSLDVHDLEEDETVVIIEEDGTRHEADVSRVKSGSEPEPWRDLVLSAGDASWLIKTMQYVSDDDQWYASVAQNGSPRLIEDFEAPPADQPAVQESDSPDV